MFQLMDTAISMPEFAIKVFTASSATPEKVDMELVMKPEAADERPRALEGETIPL
jgi:hypothetical protein